MKTQEEIEDEVLQDVMDTDTQHAETNRHLKTIIELLLDIRELLTPPTP